MEKRNKKKQTGVDDSKILSFSGQPVGMPPLRRVAVEKWVANTRYMKRVHLSPAQITERRLELRTIETEIGRIKDKIKPDEDSIETLKRREKLLEKVVDTGVEFEEVAVMEVPDETLKVVRLVDASGVVVGDREFNEDDLQEKLV